MIRNLEKLMRVSVVFFVVIVFLSGCTSISKQIGRDLEPMAKDIKISRTHFHDILDNLGPPDQITALPGGFVFLYESLLITEKQIGISSTKEVLNWFKLSFSDADVDRLVHIFTFDKRGYLRSHVGKMTSKDIGDGSSLQFLFTVEEMVNTNYLEKDPVQQDWGFLLLKPIPQTLNSNQSLDSGAGGLEQIGTPTAVGQRTLEMR